MLPKISIVTPSFQQGRFIERTIRSVEAQHYRNYEHIVIDGASTDETVAILERHAAGLTHWQSAPDDGQYDAINQGFAKSTGDVLAWLNSDDIYFPWTLAVVAEIFAEFPDVQWLMGTPCQIQNEAVHNVYTVAPRPREFIEAGLYNSEQLSWIQQESCFWRRSLWAKAGPLNQEFRYAADFDLWTRFGAHAELAVTMTLLGGFSVWETNRSRLHHDRYAAEVNEIIAALPEPVKQNRSRLCNDIAAFEKVHHYSGLRGLVRRWRNLSRHTGPVIKRNVALGKFEIERVPFFR